MFINISLLIPTSMAGLELQTISVAYQLNGAGYAAKTLR
jgi:hypothetical protein